MNCQEYKYIGVASVSTITFLVQFHRLTEIAKSNILILTVMTENSETLYFINSFSAMSVQVEFWN